MDKAIKTTVRNMGMRALDLITPRRASPSATAGQQPTVVYSDIISEILLCITAVSLVESRVMAVSVGVKHVSILAFIFWIWSVFILDILLIACLAIVAMIARTQSVTVHAFLLLACYSIMVLEILLSCANINYMEFSRNQIDWRIAFDVQVSSSNRDMFAAQFSYAFFLFGTQIAVGFSLWLIRQRVKFSKIMQGLSNTHLYQQLRTAQEHYPVLDTLGWQKWGIVAACYLLCVACFRPSDPWNAASSSILLDLALTYAVSLQAIKPMARAGSFFSSDFELNFLASKIQQPRVDLTKSLTHLDGPIKHVVMVLMESVRSDVIPLRQSFFEATGKSPVDGADLNLTPFLNDLIPKSVHTNATATTSYTLKSVMSNNCGLYPLDVNFNKEYVYGQFYSKCLPELLKELYPNRSKSLFSSSSGGDFDQQSKLLDIFAFDEMISYETIKEKNPFVAKVGWFGSSDDSSLPFIRQWVEESLQNTTDAQLFLSALTTGTHFPWNPPLGYGEQPVVNDGELNKYLNTVRISDTYIQDLVQVYKDLNIYNETLFLFLGDHGHGLKDYGSNFFGALNNPHELGFDIPLIIFNEKMGGVDYALSRVTSLDILPTIIDALVSSSSASPSASNFLTDLEDTSKLQTILDTYDGKSLLRPFRIDESFPLARGRRDAYRESPFDVHLLELKELESLLYSKGFTFHLDNPGHTHYNVRQFHRKLTYDVKNDQYLLFHLGFDHREEHNLLDVNMETDLPWLDVRFPDIDRLETDFKNWGWTNSFFEGLNYLSKRGLPHGRHPPPDDHRHHPRPARPEGHPHKPPPHGGRPPPPPPQRLKFDQEMQWADSYIDTLPDGKIDLKVMLEWAEDAAWIASGAKELIRRRYELKSKQVHIEDVVLSHNGTNSTTFKLSVEEEEQN